MGQDTALYGDSQTFTVSSCRFYLDEGYGSRSLFLTFDRYSRMAEWAYNYKYDEKFLGKKHGENFTRNAKKHYAELYRKADEKDGYFVPLTDYYVTSLDSHANGAIRSQKELLKLYKQENEARIAACLEKIEKTKETLTVHLEIKRYITAFSRAVTKGTPAPDDTIPEKYGFFLRDGKICFYKRKQGKPILWMDAYKYECSLDKKIRAEKARIALIGEKVKRLRSKEFQIPRRATFGGRAEYKKKDTKKYGKAERNAWRMERERSRRSRICFNGRHTSKYGNFQCRYDVRDRRVDITLLDGSILTLRDVSFPYRGGELEEYLLHREGSVGYVLEFKTDGHGRDYLILKAAITRHNPRINASMETGCIAFDTNADCLAWCDIDGNGNRIETGIVPFRIEKRNSQESEQKLAKAVNTVVGIACSRHKPVAMEDLDFFRKKAAMAYRDKDENRILSAFAYAKITELTRGACYRSSIGLYVVSPAYTSLIGRLKYIRPLGCTIHEAAAFVIGRRAMGIQERIPGYLKKAGKTGRGSFWGIWKPIQSHTPKLPWRMFRTRFPDFYTWKAFEKCFDTPLPEGISGSA